MGAKPPARGGEIEERIMVGSKPHRIDGWWNRSTAGFQEASLGRDQPKESSQDEALARAQRFVRQTRMASRGPRQRRQGLQPLWRPRLRSRLARAVVSLYPQTSPFPSPSMLSRSSSPSRVRSAAPTPRALDCSGRPASNASPTRERGSGVGGFWRAQSLGAGWLRVGRPRQPSAPWSRARKNC